MKNENLQFTSSPNINCDGLVSNPNASPSKLTSRLDVSTSTLLLTDIDSIVDNSF